MDNMNRVDLEGTIVFTPEITEKDGKKAINFLVENERKSRTGVSRFKYNCVAWGSVAERIFTQMKEGVFVRIAGHLQDNVLVLPDGKQFHYSKVCADRIDFSE